MNVLIISRGYPRKGDPLFGNFEAEQARALQKAGCDVTVLYVDWRPKSPIKRKFGITSFLDGCIKIYGIFLFPFPIKSFPRLSIVLRQSQCSYLYRIIRNKIPRPDIIHVHFLFNLPLAVYIGERYSIPVVATEHWSALMNPGNPAYLGIYSRYYKRTKNIISVSKILQKAIMERSGISSSVIYNIVSEEFFHTSLRKKSSPEISKRKFRIISVGRLVALKHFELIIEAVAHLLSDGFDVELDIAGDGPEKDRLADLITALDVASKVKLLGLLGKEELLSRLKESDMFVLASSQETFGVAFAEALSTGMPVISTSCGGPEEFINDNNGLLVPVNNLCALTDAMSYMIRNYEKYNHDIIKNECVEKFSSNVIADKIIKIYSKIIS